MMPALRIFVFLVGLAVVLLTIRSVIFTLLLPRSKPDSVERIVFEGVRMLYKLRLRRATSYEQRDQVMATYAPVALLTLLPIWLGLILIGYALMYWATGILAWDEDVILSGSSLFTLGFASSTSLTHTLLAFTEATIGLILVALLIAYLPTIYGNYSRREVAVTQLSSRAGAPPSATEFILRASRIGALDQIDDFWESWETLFAEIEESHTSLAVLVFLRSPQTNHSWLTASGTVLDAASLLASTVDIPRRPRSELCIRAGFLALRRIADFYHIDYDVEARFPEHPISLSREEFDAVCANLSGGGVPVKPDLDQAWQDFGGWRVNYDRALTSLCELVNAPYAPWSSDRSAPLYRSDGSAYPRPRT